MERAFKGDDFSAFGLIFFEPVFPRHFHGKFSAFRAGVGEKASVGEGFFDQFICQRFLLWDVIEVRRVPERLCLVGDCLNQFRMGVAQCVHGDAGPHIEETSAISLDQPAAFAFDEAQRCAGIGWQNGRDHGRSPEN